MNFSKGLLAFRVYDSRLISLRSIYAAINCIGLGHRDAIKSSQVRSVITNSQALVENEASPPAKTLVEKELSKKAKISKAMRAYLQRSVEQDKFMKEKVTEYEIGKRHLANMMGENPETFTQDDINNAISYLFPSGLFEPRARPVMKHPHELFPKKKEAQFDEMGRPFHSLFYTGRPALFSIFQEISIKAQELDALLHKMKTVPTDQTLNVTGTKLLSKEKIEEIILESITDDLLEHLTRALERIIEHPLSSREREFIMKFRRPISTVTFTEGIPELMYKENGIPYMTATGSRKTCKADVTVYGKGTGKITINGDDILFFDSIQDREQVMFPLQFSRMLRSVDVEATVGGGGKSGQAGALRYAISLALRSFLEQSMIEKMRIAGLLTKDARKKERKKPGRMRARRRFTWKKR